MASEYPSGQMARSSQCLDRISTLQIELITCILTFVPIRDAVRTSVLSWDWRYKWMTIPKILIRDSSVPRVSVADREHEKRLVDFVNHVMLLHFDKLYKFDMEIYLESSSNDVDRWIHLLARKLVEEVVLGFSGSRYTVPSTLFSCQYLRQLKLHHCILKSSSRMNGFNSLVDLYLHGVTFTYETIRNLISNSKQLQNLTLIHCDGFDHLSISAPNLRIFNFNGPCWEIFFNCPKLIEAFMGLLPVGTGVMINQFGISKTHMLELILAGLRRVEMLFISEHFMEILAICVAPKKLRTTYYHLRDLSFVINFSNSKLFPIVLCLFRSSPCLQSLTIFGPSIGQFRVVVEDEFGFDFPNEEEIIFPELETITVSEFRGLNNELGFVKFILVNAVKLHTMNIIWYPDVPFDHRRSYILERILQFRRTSTTAVVNIAG
ncbi:F-box/FBD/LRR-repeat protein [Thalictrum thalictroides]|uniref:F-box/FBD/LRR-repeat protein n=1 Tax=Thalictrum thalictroides TaxID=46969 RepID=A0A7J6WPC5_THATH|nr:F-box/FBD/LRR-repeat protein [Thalictrum thalictroides]